MVCPFFRLRLRRSNRIISTLAVTTATHSAMPTPLTAVLRLASLTGLANGFSSDTAPTLGSAIPAAASAFLEEADNVLEAEAELLDNAVEAVLLRDVRVWEEALREEVTVRDEVRCVYVRECVFCWEETTVRLEEAALGVDSWEDTVGFDDTANTVPFETAAVELLFPPAPETACTGIPTA